MSRSPQDTVALCEGALLSLDHSDAMDGPFLDEEDRARRAGYRAYWRRKRAAAAALIPQLPLGPASAGPSRRGRAQDAAPVRVGAAFAEDVRAGRYGGES